MLDSKGFDLWADGYDKSVNVSEESNEYPFAGYKDVVNHIYNQVREKDGACVLDIGFGTGILTTQLYNFGCNITGIDFSNDPLLQGRLFSYTDTQLIRLGGPNFHELPINRPVCPFHNNQRDGYGRQTINKGPVSYHKNSIAQNTPATAPEEEGGYTHYQEKMEGRKVRKRSESFKDHFSQATLFWNSMSKPEQEHIKQAFSFELGKLERKEIQHFVRFINN